MVTTPQRKKSRIPLHKLHCKYDFSRPFAISAVKKNLYYVKFNVIIIERKTNIKNYARCKHVFFAKYHNRCYKSFSEFTVNYNVQYLPIETLTYIFSDLCFADYVLDMILGR